MIKIGFKKVSRFLVKNYRIKDWFYLTGFFLLGYSLNKPRNFDLSIFSLEFAVVCLSLAYAFSFNEIFEEYRSPSKAVKILLLSIVPLLLSVSILPLTSPEFQLSISIFLLLFTIYSLPRFGLKSVPFISSLSNTIGFSLLFLSGSGFNLDLYSTVFLFLCCSFQLVSQLVHEMEHLEIDKRYNAKTTAIFIGVRNCERICKIISSSCILQTIFIIFLSNDYLYSLFFIALPSITLSVYSLLRISKTKPKRFRESFRVLGIIVGFLFLLHNLLAT